MAGPRFSHPLLRSVLSSSAPRTVSCGRRWGPHRQWLLRRCLAGPQLPPFPRGPSPPPVPRPRVSSDGDSPGGSSRPAAAPPSPLSLPSPPSSGRCPRRRPKDPRGAGAFLPVHHGGTARPSLGGRGRGGFSASVWLRGSHKSPALAKLVVLTAVLPPLTQPRLLPPPAREVTGSSPCHSAGKSPHGLSWPLGPRGRLSRPGPQGRDPGCLALTLGWGS